MHVQVDYVGEQVLDVGAPNGWGPQGLTPEQLAKVLDRLRAAAGKVEADVSVIREHAVEAGGTQGGGLRGCQPGWMLVPCTSRVACAVLAAWQLCCKMLSLPARSSMRSHMLLCGVAAS